jgi:Protein of unknown function (DUF3489)
MGNTSVIPSCLAFSPGFRRWGRQRAGTFQTEVSMSNAFTAAEVSNVQVGVEDRQTATAAVPTPETRLAKRSRTPRRSASDKTSRSKTRRSVTAATTKQELVLQMLRRQSGVSIDDIASKTDWQPHSVRGFLSAVVRKKLKLLLLSELGKDGVRRYRVAPLKAAKA